MQNGKVSTIRFNEWICVCAQYEKAVARIGRQVYQAYSRGLVSDYACIEMCKDISQAFSDSKQIRADLEEELERDALRGLSVEEARKAEEVLQLTEGQKFVRKVKLKFTKLMGKQAVSRSLQSYRDRVRDLSRDLGLRALALHDKEPILKMESHIRLCQLAIKLDEDSNKKWEEIVAGKSEKGGLDISFHHLLVSFVGSFANFSRNTALGKMLLKMVKYNPEEEEKKLTKQFEGTTTAAALEAQMAEVEEPDLDIGREMATMERDYEETPTDWGLPPRPAMESWVPDVASSWSPDLSAPEPTPPAPAPVAEAPKPQVLRQRPAEPAKGAWSPSAPAEEEDHWAPPAPAPAAAAPRIGKAKAAEAEEEFDDWASEGMEEEVSADPSPRLGGAPGASGGLPGYRGPSPVGSEKPAQAPPAPSPTATPVAPPVAAAPPVAPPPQQAPSPPTSPVRPQSSEDIPLPPLPPLPTRPLRSSTETPPPGTRPSAPPAGRTSGAPRPAAPGANAGVPVRPTTPPADDPLLKLLRPEPTPEPLDDDDLLPAFLRERKDDDIGDVSGFIPDLPDSVDSGLKIMPFGANRNKADEGPGETFIPQMPD